jgi:energy-coupling factor transporter ATP-binding protein EcfA2
MKEVIIIGLQNHNKMGILKACELKFSEENRLVKIKGASGHGKSTLKKTLDLGTKGSKSMIDKNLYGEIDTETQLLDGETKIFVGCKSKDDGSLVYTLYTKDLNGKIIREPVIDGVKATPAKYLELLQTELTWRMDELISENPTVQRKILLDLYKFELQKQGVIFDTKHPDYKESILGKIDTAVSDRDLKDMLRKEKGGILEDLKAKGFDPDRPDTIPDAVNISLIDTKINELEKEKAVTEVNIQNQKENVLNSIKTEAATTLEKAKSYNERLKVEYQLALSNHQMNSEKEKIKTERIEKAIKAHNELKELGYNGSEVAAFIELMPNAEKIERPTDPKYIKFDEDSRVIIEEGVFSEEVISIFTKLKNIRARFLEEDAKPTTYDSTEVDAKIESLKLDKINAESINKIVNAVDSFHSWRASDIKVRELKQKYYDLLANVDTGVSGLKIVHEEKTNEIFLMYNGEYDTDYFRNTEKEYRKLAAYSGTQQPLICLLVQNYLLSKKPKALRYMYIDNIPIDRKAQEVLADMCEKLQLRVFVNITGDFDKDGLKDGEILIEGGEVFFNGK